jgi:hypothetical protein
MRNASRDYRQPAKEQGIMSSSVAKASAGTTPWPKSCFATLKREFIDRLPWPTIAGLHWAVFDTTEGWYYTRRLYSSLVDLRRSQYETGIDQEINTQAA